MASKSTDFLVRILADANQGVGELDRFGHELTTTVDVGGAHLGKLSAIAGGVAGLVSQGVSRMVDGLSELASEARVASDATDKFKQTLNFAGVDEGTIGQLTAQTRAYADRTVYDLATIQNTTAQLAANSVPDYEALTEAAGNLNAVAGGNAETFRSVSMVLTQTAGAQKLTTENWNQLSDAIPGASGKIQEALARNGAFTGNFRDAMEKGEITAQEFNAALLELGSQPVAVEAAQSTSTFEGALGNLQATIVGGLADSITRIKPMVTGAITWLSGRIGEFFTWQTEAYTGLVALLGRGDFTAAFRTAFGVAEDSPAIAVILRVRDGLIQLGAVIGTTFLATFQQLRPVFAGLVPQLIDLWSAISPVSLIFEILGPQLPPLIRSIGELAVGAGQVLAGALQVLLPVITTLVGWLVQAATWLAQNRDIVLAVGVAWLTWQGISTVIDVVRAAQIGYAAATYGATGATYASVAASRLQAIAAQAGAAAVVLQNTALYRSVAAWVANTAAVATNNSLSLTTKAAIIASSVATGVATAAQWAWNAALTANPIGIIIVAIAALVAGLVWFFTQTDLGRQVWENVTTAIATAARWLWESVLQPVFTAIGAVFTWIYENIIRPIVFGIVLYVSIWATIFTWLWQTILSPIFAAIGTVFTWIYQNIIVPIVNGIVTYVQAWATVFTWLWGNVLAPTFAAMGAIFTWLYENVIIPIVNGIVLYIQAWATVFTWLWGNVLAPTFAAIGSGFSWVYDNVIRPVSTWISQAIMDVGATIHNVFDGIAGFVGGVFNGILTVVKAPINGLISLINGMIDGLNSIRVDVPAIPGISSALTIGFNLAHLPHLATGGVTTGPLVALIGDNPGGREMVQPLEAYYAQAEDIALAVAARTAPAAQSSARSDRPIYADGIGLIGWIREVAGEEAQLVWATADADRAQTARMGRQRGV